MNLLQIARENLYSYEKRHAKEYIKKLDEQIKEGSFLGNAGTHISIKGFLEDGELVSIIRKNYEDQGFKVEIDKKDTLWIWWNEE